MAIGKRRLLSLPRQWPRSNFDLSDGKDANMIRLRRIRLVQLGVILFTISCAASAWSQQSSGGQSLADRIREMRSGGNSAESSGASDDSSGTAPVPTDQSTGRPRSTTPAGQSGLPQINAKSLIPFNLFGRPSTNPNDGKEPQPMPARTPSAAAKKAPVTTSQSDTTQSSARPRVGSAANSSAPGQAMAPITPITPAAKPPIAKLPITKPLAVDAPPSPVRSSPEQRAPLNFDPDALRNDLAGAFPAPANKEHPTLRDGSTDNALSRSKDSDAENATGPIGPSTAVQPLHSHANSSAGASPSGAAVDSHQPFPTVGSLLGHRANSPAKTGTASGEAGAGDVNVDARDAGSKAFQSSGMAIPATKAKQEPVTMTPVKSSESAAGHFDGADKENDAPKPDGTAVLATNRAPVIASDMEGPRQIMVGRDACYHLLLRNEGAAPAEDFVASIRIPYWADVVNTSATKGVVQLPHDNDGKSPGTLEWKIEKLDPQTAETLTLHLIPHESRQLELGVSWTHAAIGSKATVEVQEPKLKMQIAGPDEVLFGKSQIYRLTLTNPGTGPAENVKIDLMPPGGNESSVSTHKLGNLAAGTSKSVEVELTARQAGKLSVKAIASADGGLASDAIKELFCRKPELEVDWRGPDSQYAGTAATYYFRVRNPGTATAEDVTVHVSLPEGAKFVSASDGQLYDPERRDVMWRVGSLRPGDDCYTELKCTVNTLGKNQLQVAASTASGDLTDNKVAATNVVGLADLKLDIKDPPGPLPIGEEAVYEIDILNRGNNAAQDVNVIALFSDGLEPAAIEGGAYTVSDGRVSFHGIEKIAAGQTASLRIHAKAVKPGTHVFRAEVICKDLEIKLAAEETTRFYQDEVKHDESPPTSQPTLGAKETETVR
jgi:uncharacterized repeat protein (TIGR01451 family)